MTSVVRRLLVGLGVVASATAATSQPRDPLAPLPVQPQPQRQSLPIITSNPAPFDLRDTIERIGRSFDGKAGIAIINLRDGWEIGYGANSLFPQQSCSKLWVAITMLDAMAALASDPATKVLLLVSKPPAPKVAERVLAAAAAASTPAVVCFLGADPDSVARPGIKAAETLEDAAALAVELSTGAEPNRAEGAGDIEAAAAQATAALAPSQRYIRGLFSGGTFGYEASLLLSRRLGRVNSNTPARPEDTIADVWKSEGHTIIDLGDDVFTRGRPHPMIDFRLRVERIAEEAADPEVAVILLDVVLGYGAHEDPAGQLIPAITDARASAAAQGRAIAFVASVCGTEGDPQGLVGQERVLREEGVLLGTSNAHAVRIAADIVQARQGGEGR